MRPLPDVRRASRRAASAGRAALLLAAAALPVLAPASAGAADDAPGPDACVDGRALEHAFGSGASWSLCARVDDVHGLELVDVRYRAPGDSARPVLRSLHLAQLLVHWHDEPRPERRLGGTTPATRGLGGAASVALDAANCDGEPIALGAAGGDAVTDGAADAPAEEAGVEGAGTEDGPRGTLCARVRASGLLAKYAQRAAVHAASWELFAVARQGLLTWRVGVELTEDGQIVPSVALSGRSERTGGDRRFATALDTRSLDLPGESAGGADELLLARATLLTTWRLHFALDTPTPDRIEEFDFPLEPALDNRRPMRVRALDGEAFRRVAPTRFRGWRVLDPTSGAGYLLDPIDSGHAWNARGGDWSRFEFALTRARDCERRAEANVAATSDDAAAAAAEVCGGGLDEFVNGEALDGGDPVIWYSRTRLWTPRLEDLPFLSSVVTDMRLVPFDWTASSPFEATE